MPDASEEQPQSYIIRVGEEAFDNIEEAADRFALMEGERIASEWQTRLYDFAAGLALFPHRYQLAPESDLFRVPVRDPIYRRASYSAPYRVLFTIVEADLAATMGESPSFYCLPCVMRRRRGLMKRRRGASRLVPVCCRRKTAFEDEAK